MLYHVKPGQVSYGEAVGIILLENYVPFIPGDVANANSYDFPVRFRPVPGFSVERIFSHDMSITKELVEAARDLEANGVRCITGDCGFMALYQNHISEAVSVPVAMSSLSQIPFLRTMLRGGEQIGIVTANAKSISDDLLQCAGVEPGEDLAFMGLENTEHFRSAVFEEQGSLDSELVEREVLEAVRTLRSRHPQVSLLLLECSLLPPYSAAVSRESGLAVFDYLSMIQLLYRSCVPPKYTGFM